MKKFVYSLEAVMNYKQQVLEAVKEEYAKRLEKVAAKNQEIENMKQRQQSLAEAFDEVKHSGAEIERFLMYSELIAKLQREIEYQYKLLAELEEKAEEKKIEVVEAHIDLNKYIRLRERKLQEYKHEVQKDEEAFIEEFVANASSRKILDH
uniref:Flagellar FliJ protein n=1 Tax=Eubacterium cellulosolvens (strain ATCC 43171 / JCM 9499 / 6) TaxID=633697 RepID=I5ARW5_EUBC6